MTIDKSKFEYTHTFALEDEEFHVRAMIPYAKKSRWRRTTSATP